MSTYMTTDAQVAGKLEDVMKVHQLILEAESSRPSEDFRHEPGTPQHDSYVVFSYHSGKSRYAPQVYEVLKGAPGINALDVCLLASLEFECYLRTSFCWFKGIKKATAAAIAKRQSPHWNPEPAYRRNIKKFNAWCAERGIRST